MFKEATVEDSLISLCEEFGFDLLIKDDNHYFIRVQRDDIFIDIWWTKMTIGIYSEGRKTFLRDVSRSILIEVLSSPLNYLVY